MKKFVNTIAAIVVSASFAVQAESTACWEYQTMSWPIKNIIIKSDWSPMLPMAYETSGGIKAMIQFVTMAHSIALTQVSGSINGQKYMTQTTNEMAGGLGGTQFTGTTEIPRPLICGLTENWVKVESWLYEPGAQIGSTNFYAKAFVLIRGH